MFSNCNSANKTNVFGGSGKGPKPLARSISKTVLTTYPAVVYVSYKTGGPFVRIAKTASKTQNRDTNSSQIVPQS